MGRFSRRDVRWLFFHLSSRIATLDCLTYSLSSSSEVVFFFDIQETAALSPSSAVPNVPLRSADVESHSSSLSQF